VGAGAFPRCRRCGAGDLVPLSDYGARGAPVPHKAWVCTNPACGYNLKIRGGEVAVGEPVRPPRRPRGTDGQVGAQG